MYSVGGCQSAILDRDVIRGAIGARRWLPGILFATVSFLLATFTTWNRPATLCGKKRKPIEIGSGSRRMLGLELPPNSVGVLRIFATLKAPRVREEPEGFGPRDC